MSNRFNKPEMLKANRKRYFETAMFYHDCKAAIQLLEIEKQAHDRMREEENRHRAIRIRPRRPWHERFMEWATGC